MLYKSATQQVCNRNTYAGYISIIDNFIAWLKRNWWCLPVQASAQKVDEKLSGTAMGFGKVMK